MKEEKKKKLIRSFFMNVVRTYFTYLLATLLAQQLAILVQFDS